MRTYPPCWKNQKQNQKPERKVQNRLGTALKSLVDRGDFSLSTTQQWSEFLISLNVLTSML